MIMYLFLCPLENILRGNKYNNRIRSHYNIVPSEKKETTQTIYGINLFKSNTPPNTK